jgi:hypothetical protein
MPREWIKRMAVVINAGKALVDDRTASIAPEMFDKMSYVNRNLEDIDIPLIKVGTRINWNGVLKKAAVDIWDTEQNNPDNAPTLWTDIDYRNGYRIIPEVITTTLAFSEGEIGWWKDSLYFSKVNANVYNPDVYPDNWELYANNN